jgi:TatA/E family protein of Tat protein translocase
VPLPGPGTFVHRFEREGKAVIRPQHLILLLLLGVLLFGRRLPEVGRSLGRLFAQFRQGLREIEDQLGDAVADGPKRPWRTLPGGPNDPEDPPV